MSRQDGRDWCVGARGALTVAAGAWLIRAVIALGVAWLAASRNGMAILLDDEASYHWATIALLTRAPEIGLPDDLRHLSGNAYLGLTVPLYALFGPEPTILRMVNVTLGAVAVVLVIRIARRVWGAEQPALLAGILAAVWAPLILWSAMILRDTLVSVSILAVWWAILTWERGNRLRSVAALAFGLILLYGLRPYVLWVVVVGLALVVALKRVQVRAAHVASALAIAVLAGGGVALLRPALVDQMIHNLAYKQSVVRLEALGTLYGPRDPPSTTDPLQLGALVAIPARQSAVRVPVGVVYEHVSPQLDSVAFTDGSVEVVPRSELAVFQTSWIPWPQIVLEAVPSTVTVLFGYADSSSGSARLVWIADAFAWDALLVVGVIGLFQSQRAREHLLPVVVVLGTVLVLSIIPNAPANAARHRAVQTAPLLIVFAAGAVIPWMRRIGLVYGPSSTRTGRTLAGAKIATSSPTSASAPAASRSLPGR